MLPLYLKTKTALCNRRRGLQKWLLVMVILFTIHLIPFTAYTQTNITRVEYYIDIDPGNGNATALGIVPGPDLVDQNIAINPATVTEGVHRLYVRAMDANGKWSMTNTWLFYKPYGNGGPPPVPPPPSNITRVEYYIDIDPGIGNATSLTITSSTDIQDAIIPIDPATVSEGVHRLYVRALNANGNWSLTNTWLFYKPYGNGGPPPVPPPPSNITRVEYYIDNDPGFNNATTLAITSSTDIQDAIISIDPATVAEGVHRLYVRALNANGNWSLTNVWLFYKPYSNTGALITPAIAKLSNLEYYIDNDPGYGNGVPVALDSLTDIADYIVPINVTGQTAGAHKLWFRGLDKNGKWSLMNKWDFTVPSVLPSPSIIVNSAVRKIDCAKDSITLSYHATGTYNAGNIFNLEISDATGTFAATPTVIGSYTGTGNTIIKAILPSHLPDGANYHVRVSSTNPVVAGVSGSDAITIHDRPVAQTISGNTEVNTGSSYPYSVPSFTGSAWAWVVPAATISQTANTANLTWNIAGQPQTIKVIETNQYGCIGDTSIKNVNVYTLKVDNVYVSSLTPCPAENITVTLNATGVYNAGNVFTAQLSDAAGSFASPVNIGTLTNNPVGLSQPVSINATLPYPLVNGTGYRVRVVSSSPVTTSADNGQNININKPNIGVDKSITIGCANGSADITALYNTSGLTAVYSAATPTAATPGVYDLYVTNSNGCKDSAVITVLDASTATVPAAGSNTKTANRECTDAQGWTHYYFDNGTPTDYSDDIRLLSIKKNGNNIGTTGDGTFQLKVAATAGAGSNHAVNVNSPLLTPGSQFYSMNRYWNITPTTQPTSAVGIRFYYNTQDLTDVNGDYPSGNVNHNQLTIYKLQGGNPDPTSNWSGATANNYYANGSSPNLTTWIYTNIGNNIHQAEFTVNSFSGGGAGAMPSSPLPVTFISFNVNVLKDKVQLLWATATEVNSKEFKVQRSLDGINFEPIATIAAAGNSSTVRNYLFDDLQSISLKGQVIFYRIIESDLDGHTFFTNIKNVKIDDGKKKLTLVYNPVQHEALLKYDCAEKDKVQIRVVDNLGRVLSVIEKEVIAGTNQIKLQTGNFAKGIYEVELTGKNSHEHVRMMKE